MSAHNLFKQEQDIINLIKQKSIKLKSQQSLQPLLDEIGDKRIVMLGEASHGTHEYYTWRSYITRKLIEEKGFDFIAVEGDWPDCFKINQYIKQKCNKEKDVMDILSTFNRWPTWMWANWEIAALTEWLYHHNLTHTTHKVGFYGLDVYSLWESLHAITNYLKKNNKEALDKALEAFKCFEPYKGNEGTSYAYATQLVPHLCQNEVVNLLVEIQKKASLNRDDENIFSAEQNALIAVNAEKYFNAMVKGGPQSWNIRDSHMQETLERLMHLHGPESKAIVWEHNTHIGDARATDMADEGMYNLGELARKRYGEHNVALVGFGSYTGSVIAGNSWGANMQEMDVPEARESSWEYLLHKAGDDDKLLLMDNLKDTELGKIRIGHRAIGVVYRPQYEHYGNYVPSVIPQRYDAFIFINETNALHPIHMKSKKDKMPETFPFGQ